MKVTKVLDKGFVKLVDVMGNDDRICEAARTSTNSKGKNNAGLIDYLMRNRHSSPFEFCEFVFHIKCPIFVFRQIVRHRTASLNETSLRYSKANDEFWIPEAEDIRKQGKKNMQMTDEAADLEIGKRFISNIKKITEKCFELYEDTISNGVCREQARAVLPVNIYTQFYWKIDLNNLLKFLTLRMDKHAQQETREFANAIYDHIKEYIPLTCNSFEEHILQSVTFSNTEKTILFKMLKENGFDFDEYKKRLKDSMDETRYMECVDRIDGIK